jgi:sulfide:quinone oxidoreductase
MSDMTEPSKLTSNRVVIVGGGVAGLEALVALRALGGDRVDLTLVSQHDRFIDRPMTVAEPFCFKPAAQYSLPEITAEFGADFIRATVTAVDGTNHRVSCAGGADLVFDTLILAPGARPRPAFSNAITFGLEGSSQAIGEMLGQLRRGKARSVAFVAPTKTGWLLPLYELALMTALELARNNIDGVQLRFLSPEDRPLALFGGRSSQTSGRLMAAAGIEFIRADYVEGPGGSLMHAALGESPTDYVVTLPLLYGPDLAGVPVTQPHGFIPVDEFGRVKGLTDIYAAGDAVDFPIKQGGLAAQQADAVAEHVAARYGASLEPEPFRPALRGMLFTGTEPRYFRTGVPGADADDPDAPGAWHPLWWPPTKVAGRYLAPYLFGRGDEDWFGPHPDGFTDIEIPLTAGTLPG